MRTRGLITIVATTLLSRDSFVLGLKEDIDIPSGWKPLDRPITAEHLLKLTIHLRQQNVDRFEQKLIEISTPRHPSHRKHMSQSEIDEMLAPSEAAVEDVTGWLESNGISSYTVKRDTIRVQTTVGKTEELLDGAKYGWYKHLDTGKVALRTLEYSFPDSLDMHIDTIQPTIFFGLQKHPGLRTRPAGQYTRADMANSSELVHNVWNHADPFRSNGDLPAKLNCSTCDECATPACIATAYRFRDFEAANNSVVGIVGLIGEHADHEDFQAFLNLFVPGRVGLKSNFAVIDIAGANDTQHDDDFVNDGEANLDTQVMASLSLPNKAVFYSVGGTSGYTNLTIEYPDPTDEPWFNFLEYLLDQPQAKLPTTISTSYGIPEQAVSPAYAYKLCNMMAQLGARGVSMLYASADAGPGKVCLSGKSCVAFNPDFPATCPWVTGVGAVANFDPQKAAFFSGGGFSNYFSVPDYQRCAVNGFLGSHPEQWENFAGNDLLNTSGRGVPDVSAAGVNFQIFVNGTILDVDGTSAATPTFAGIIALLNSEMIRLGLPPLGFLNPWLYSEDVRNHGGLTDIVSGNSVGCNGTYFQSPLTYPKDGVEWAIVPDAGFTAVSGWDPVSGLGTPDFPGLLGSL